MKSGVNIINEQKWRARKKDHLVFIINIPSSIQFRPV